MKKHLPILFILLLCCTGAFAQIPEATQEASQHYQMAKKNGNDPELYNESKELIDQSVLSEGMNNAYSWHVRGYIYKEMFKYIDKQDRNSVHRPIAIESFQRAIELDTERKYYHLNVSSLKYMASTYYNDGVILIKNRDEHELMEAPIAYKNYKKTYRLVDYTFDFRSYDKKFLKAYATANRKLIEDFRNDAKIYNDYLEYFDRVRVSYKQALQIDSLDYGSNYNLAINFYNEAAYRIELLPPETELTDVIILQEGCAELFQEALPYSLRAFKLKPQRKETIKALRAIYYSLMQESKSKLFKDLLDGMSNWEEMPADKLVEKFDFIWDQVKGDLMLYKDINPVTGTDKIFDKDDYEQLEFDEED